MDTNQSLWCGFVIQGEKGQSVFHWFVQSFCRHFLRADSAVLDSGDTGTYSMLLNCIAELCYHRIQCRPVHADRRTLRTLLACFATYRRKPFSPASAFHRLMSQMRSGLPAAMAPLLATHVARRCRSSPSTSQGSSIHRLSLGHLYII